jgi:O-antigen/teichoic acid export membrane protein
MSDTFNTLKNIGKNILSLSISELVCRILGAITLLLLPRYLGPQNYGVYVLALSYLSIFSVVSNYGLDALFIKDVARDKNLTNLYFSTNVIIKALLSLLSMVVLLILIRYLNYPADTIKIIAIMSIALFFSSLSGTFTATFRAYEQMEYNAILSISRSLITLAGVIAVIKLNGTLTWIAILSVLSTVSLTLIGQHLINRKLIRIKWKTSLNSIKYAFRKSTPFFLASAIAVISNRIDIIMISKLSTDYEVGIFNAGYELINVLYIIPSLLSTVLFPVFSRQYAESSSSLIRSSTLSIKCIIIIALPMSAGLYIIAPQIVQLFYGNAFNGSVKVLQIFSLGISILFVGYIIAYILMATELLKYVIWSNTVSVIMNILLNVWFIPQWMAKGAAYSALICTIGRGIFVYAVSRKKFKEIAVMNNILKPFIATFMMGICIWWLNVNVFATVVLGIIIYTISIYLLKVLTKEELGMIRRMLPFLS